MRHIILGTVAIGIVTFAAQHVAAQPRICVRADIEESFVLPDGSEHPAGSLRICFDRAYSPVAGLHSISADGHASGTFLSRRVNPESPTAVSPQIAFMRDGAGVLVLRGYTVERSGKVEAYWLQAPRGRRPAPDASLIAKTPASATVWLAAAETH